MSLLVLGRCCWERACQTAKPPVTNDPKTPKDLIIGLDADPPSVDSYATSNAQGHNVLSLILERLIKKDAAGNYIPWLATKWELVSDTKMTFTLRDDVYFSDGTSLLLKTRCSAFRRQPRVRSRATCSARSTWRTPR
jgi:ABC-type transport system substrate-binding protein